MVRRRLKAFEDAPDPIKDKFWPRFAEEPYVFGLGIFSVGLEGWFTAEQLRALAALLDEYKVARNGVR